MLVSPGLLAVGQQVPVDLARAEQHPVHGRAAGNRSSGTTVRNVPDVKSSTAEVAALSRSIDLG